MRAGGGFGVNLAPLADMLQTARFLCSALGEASAEATEMAVQDACLRGWPNENTGAIGLL